LLYVRECETIEYLNSQQGGTEMLNKTPVAGEEITLTRHALTQHNEFEVSKGDTGRILEVADGRVLIEFTVSDKPGNHPDAMEVEDTLYLNLDELPDYIEGYHYEDPVNED
jgi:hypothetical protein